MIWWLWERALGGFGELYVQAGVPEGPQTVPVGESPPARSRSASVWKQDNPSGDNKIKQGGEAQGS